MVVGFREELVEVGGEGRELFEGVGDVVVGAITSGSAFGGEGCGAEEGFGGRGEEVACCWGKAGAERRAVRSFKEMDFGRRGRCGCGGSGGEDVVGIKVLVEVMVVCWWRTILFVGLGRVLFRDVVGRLL